ncbi:hypothetical protein STEG23_025500 [Scotinomys teguina]
MDGLRRNKEEKEKGEERKRQRSARPHGKRGILLLEFMQREDIVLEWIFLPNTQKPLNIVTDSQYAERVVLHIETAEFIPDESELTSLFIQLQDIIRNRKHPLYITHIRSHTGLPGPLAQEDENLWIASRLVWFDQPRPPDSSQTAPVKIEPSS